LPGLKKGLLECSEGEGAAFLAASDLLEAANDFSADNDAWWADVMWCM